MSDNDICSAPYTRPLKLFPNDGLVVPVPCTFLQGHGANHSWFALKHADDMELEKLRAARRDGETDLPPHITSLLQESENGDHDRYIEVLLAYLHDRKRCRRGVAGFARRTS